MTEPSSNDICYMCKNTREWHKNNYVRHPFSMTPTELRDTSRPDRRVQDISDVKIPDVVRTSMPFDPALRLALINAGVITTEQLSEAERTIAAVNNQVINVWKEPPDGEQPSSVDEDSSSGQE